MAKTGYRWNFSPKEGTVGNLRGLLSMAGCLSFVFIVIWTILMIGYIL